QRTGGARLDGRRRGQRRGSQDHHRGRRAPGGQRRHGAPRTARHRRRPPHLGGVRRMATELAVEPQRNLIGGSWVAARSGRVFENRNPADRDDLVGLFPESGREEGEAAVAAAKAAFPKWRDTPAPRRAEILYAVGEILKRDKDKLACLMTREMGKVLAETRGDVQEAIDMAFLAAG